MYMTPELRNGLLDIDPNELGADAVSSTFLKPSNCNDGCIRLRTMRKNRKKLRAKEL